jgi:S-phase kinase-associated protein 1
MSSIVNNNSNNNTDNKPSNEGNESISENDKVILVSQEGEKFEVPKKVALHSNLCKTMISGDDDDDDDDSVQEIPLTNVKGKVLCKVIEFCRYHTENGPMTEIEKPLKSPNMEEIVGDWDAKFIKVDQDLLFELILAANYMDIKDLLDLTCATVASMIKGKSPEDIRKTFNIVNDFTPEEEAQVREENKWAEED